MVVSCLRSSRTRVQISVVVFICVLMRNICFCIVDIFYVFKIYVYLIYLISASYPSSSYFLFQKLLFTTSLISGLSMCGLATYFLSKHYGFYAPDWLPIATLCLCIFCDASGLQPVSVVLTSEMFSFKVRANHCKEAISLSK